MITNLFKNKKHSFQFGIWLLFAVILMLGQQAKAADNYLNAHRAKLTDHIATDGYIQLDLPVYESDGDDEAIYNGWLYVKTTKEQDFKKAFNFYTQDHYCPKKLPHRFS